MTTWGYWAYLRTAWPTAGWPPLGKSNREAAAEAAERAAQRLVLLV